MLAACAVLPLMLIGLATAARAAAPAIDQSAPAVDQSFTAPTNLGAEINECFAFVAQTFTAGRTGALTGVSVDIRGVGSTRPRVQIRTVPSGAPTPTVLGETVLEANGASLSQVIAFPTSITVTAGVQYAIVVSYEGAPPPAPAKARAPGMEQRATSTREGSYFSASTAARGWRPRRGRPLRDVRPDAFERQGAVRGRRLARAAPSAKDATSSAR
jgi:hypothetical protein